MRSLIGFSGTAGAVEVQCRWSPSCDFLSNSSGVQSCHCIDQQQADSQVIWRIRSKRSSKDGEHASIFLEARTQFCCCWNNKVVKFPGKFKIGTKFIKKPVPAILPRAVNSQETEVEVTATLTNRPEYWNSGMPKICPVLKNQHKEKAQEDIYFLLSAAKDNPFFWMASQTHTSSYERSFSFQGFHSTPDADETPPLPDQGAIYSVVKRSIKKSFKPWKTGKTF